MDTYDAGLLNDYGGGDVGWWQDYLRAELGRAEEFYRNQHDDIVAEKDAEIARLREALIWCGGSNDFSEGGVAREGWLKVCTPLLGGSGQK